MSAGEKSDVAEYRATIERQAVEYAAALEGLRSQLSALSAREKVLREALLELLAVRALANTKDGCQLDRFEAAWKQAALATGEAK